jgi:hypothetical protein
LGPDGFVGIDDGAIVVEAVEVAVVLGIEAAREPEGEAIMEERMPVERRELPKLFGCHGGECVASSGKGQAGSAEGIALRA